MQQVPTYPTRARGAKATDRVATRRSNQQPGREPRHAPRVTEEKLTSKLRDHLRTFDQTKGWMLYVYALLSGRVSAIELMQAVGVLKGNNDSERAELVAIFEAAEKLATGEIPDLKTFSKSFPSILTNNPMVAEVILNAAADRAGRVHRRFKIDADELREYAGMIKANFRNGARTPVLENLLTNELLFTRMNLT